MIIHFPPQDENEFDALLDSIPDVEEMSEDQLKEYKGKLEDAIADLDSAEPEDEESEEYEDWAEMHEDLEDILDEILDRLEEL